MKPKITFIIKSNKTLDCIDTTQDAKCQWKEFGERLDELKKNRLVDNKLYNLYRDIYKESNNIFDITFKSLEQQTFKDFETIFVNTYADELDIGRFEKYKDTINLKIIKPKHTLWNDLGKQYIDFVNNLNTGIIWADGDIIFSTSDCIIFDKDLLFNIWNYYKKGLCLIPIRKEISISNQLTNKQIKNSYIYDYEYPLSTKVTYPAGINLKDGGYTNWWWGYGLTFPLQDCLNINGFDETFDGAYGYDDVDFAKRINISTSYRPYATKDIIYTFRKRQGNQKLIRDNVILSNIIKLQHAANEIRPTKLDMNRYKRIHINRYGEIDKNYDKCMYVPVYDIRHLREIREENEILCGKRVL